MSLRLIQFYFVRFSFGTGQVSHFFSGIPYMDEGFSLSIRSINRIASSLIITGRPLKCRNNQAF